MTDDTTITERLAEQALFADLDAAHLAFLADNARQRPIKQDEVLFRYGHRAETFYLLCEGSVSTEIAAIEGPPLELQRVGPGSVLGWSWLIPPYQWHFQARAEQPGRVLEFDGAAVLARCEEDTAFGYALFKRFAGLMSTRLGYAREKMMAEWSPSGFA